jgi:hypothetical protein
MDGVFFTIAKRDGVWEKGIFTIEHHPIFGPVFSWRKISF